MGLRDEECPPRGSGSPTILVAAGGVAQLAERYVRNVEAEGSSPFTSTKARVTGLKWDPPKIASLST